MVKTDWKKEGLTDPATLRGKKFSELSAKDARQIGLIRLNDATGKHEQRAGGSEMGALVTHVGLIDDRTEYAKCRNLLEFEGDFPW